jgi:hypothetical protein
MFVMTITGCSYFQSANTDADEEIADFDETESSDDEETADDSEPSRKTPRLTEGELELKLTVGERFPLQRKIEQRLTQGDGMGGVLVNRSLVEMMLSLVVEEVRDGNKRLSVKYHRIHYGHNIAGRQVEYNSESTSPPPPEALAYAGLKNNGFSFWIGPDNRVVEIIGFQDFLQKCVQNVPAAQREAVLRQLERMQTDEGLANFVDDGIGLLPYSDDPKRPAVAVKVGAAWELKPRRTEGAMPLSIATRCILKNLTDSSAEIGLIGKITGSSTPVAVQDGGHTMRVQLKGGHCAGSCTIDRRTGLPTQSEVNRYLEMLVQLPDGTEIAQRKEILTSTMSFLDQGSRANAVGMETDTGRRSRSSDRTESDAGRVTQVAGTNSSRSEDMDDRHSDRHSDRNSDPRRDPRRSRR